MWIEEGSESRIKYVNLPSLPEETVLPATVRCWSSTAGSPFPSNPRFPLIPATMEVATVKQCM